MLDGGFRRRPDGFHWEIGNMCLARRSEDRNFHEAVIQDITPDGLCVVKFVNYENLEIAYLRKLRLVGDKDSLENDPQSEEEMLYASREQMEIDFELEALRKRENGERTKMREVGMVWRSLHRATNSNNMDFLETALKLKEDLFQAERRQRDQCLELRALRKKETKDRRKMEQTEPMLLSQEFLQRCYLEEISSPSTHITIQFDDYDIQFEDDYDTDDETFVVRKQRSKKRPLAIRDD